MGNIDKINLEQAFARVPELFRPIIAAQVNDTVVRLAKIQGEFIWHHHEHEDELFLVVSGRLTMRFRDQAVEVEPGEMILVPRGVEHQPYAEAETHVLLIEPASTVNTGNVRNERTRDTTTRLD